MVKKRKENVGQVPRNVTGKLTRDNHQSEEVLPELSGMVFDSLHSSVCNDKVLDKFISGCRHYADRKIDVMERLYFM